jgi:hypothetical protein
MNSGLSSLALLALATTNFGQDAVLSLVSGLKAGDRVHVGVSTSDPRMDRCRILYSIGPSNPFFLPALFPGVEIVIAPGTTATLAVLAPQLCLPPTSTQVAFAYGGLIPAGIPAGVEVHLQALLSSSTTPGVRALSNGIVVVTGASGPSLTRWGASALQTALRLTRVDLDTFVAEPPIDVAPLPLGATVPLTGLRLPGQIPPVVSSNEFRAAIPMVMTDTRVTFQERIAVYVLNDIRAASPTGFWLPLVDPVLGNFSWTLAGAPRFFGNDEVWLVEHQPGAGTTTEYRLARYDVTTSPATFLSASHLDDPLFPDAFLATDEWLIDRAGQAVFLQQNRQINGQGLELVRYDPISGAPVSRVSVDPTGFAVFHAAFTGIAPVPSKPWGLVQYGTGLNGASHARLIDLDTGVITPSLAVGIRAGRFSSDGNLVLFEGTSSFPRDLVPVLTFALALTQLPAVPGYFCGGDSIATDGSTIVTAPYACSGGLVRRARLDPLGQLETATLCTSTGVGPAFEFYTGSGRPPVFSVPGRNVVCSLTGASQNVLQMLDATTMTYGTTTVTMSARFFF